MAQLECGGINRDCITIVPALGVHRAMEPDEIVGRTGISGLNYENPDCDDRFGSHEPGFAPGCQGAGEHDSRCTQRRRDDHAGPRINLRGMGEEDRFFLYFALQAMRHARLLMYGPTIPAEIQNRLPFVEFTQAPQDALRLAEKRFSAGADVLIFPHGGITYPDTYSPSFSSSARKAWRFISRKTALRLRKNNRSGG